jgi:AraC-like DNA-binding protein
VLHHGERFLRHDPEGAIERQPLAVLAGQLRTALKLQSTGRVGAFGVRFAPAGAALLLGPDADELTGRVLPLEDLVPVGVDDLVEAVAEADGDEARLHVVTRWLLQRLEARGGTRNGSLGGALTSIRRGSVWDTPGGTLGGVFTAVQLMERRGGDLDVAGLARHLGWSTRRLQRAFLAHVGLSPKTFCRVVRFQGVVRALGRHPATRLSALALGAGYADQAHLARDFKELAGLSATSWLAQQHRLNDCFTGALPATAPRPADQQPAQKVLRADG